MVAITPGGRVGDNSPLGRSGKRKLVDYVREVAHALMREHGFSKSHAIATAKNSLRKWARGGGKVRPQVRAGAAAGLSAQKALDASGGGRRTSLANADGKRVRATLGKHYPQHVLEWVKGAEWSRESVPLSGIRMRERPGEPHDPGKVKSLRKAIRRGKPLPPVVLVNTGRGKHKIADGYHRTRAMRQEGLTHADALVARVDVARGPWSRSMHDAKLNK